MRLTGTTSLVWLAAGLAAASVVVAAAPLPRLFAGDSGLPAPRSVPMPGSAAAPVSIDPILQLSPFGRLLDAVTGTAPPQEAAPGLVLHGVVIALPAENSTAILSGTGKPARVFRIGEEIAPSVTLAKVLGDHVELLVDGAARTLSFPQPVRASTVDPAAAEGDLGALRQLIAGAAAGYSDAGGATTGDPANQPEDVAARIERYRATLRDDPQRLLDELGLAAFDDGYRVSRTASDDLLSTGLLPGDIVATVNGQQVGNIDQDIAHFDAIIASGNATLGIVREGERLMVSLPLK
jgi:general secretion pathway protein C